MIKARAKRNLAAGTFWRIVPPLLLVLGSLLLFAYLLRRFPYDGMYGIDSFTYFYQARAIWEEATGAPHRAFELFSVDGLQHWPVGYHLQVITGFLFGGTTPRGGWLLTILFAALCPAILFLLVQRLLGALRASGYAFMVIVAGLIAGLLLPLNATYTRMGLSLMSDVPACFFSLLSLYFFVRAAPLPDGGVKENLPLRQRSLLFGLAGFAFGLAVLMRYGSGVVAIPLGIYLIFSALPADRDGKLLITIWPRLAPALWSVPAFFIALLPQVFYLLTHDPGTGAGDFLSSFSLGNLFATSTSGPDGVSNFQSPMIVFYVLGPLWQTQAGFYSLFFLPALVLGAAFMFSTTHRRLLSFLAAWWLFPALIYAATPYQAHRFALIYLPAIAILIGTGVGFAVSSILTWVPRLVGKIVLPRWSSSGRQRYLASWVGAGALISFAIGLILCWNSVRDWMATHSAWEQADRMLVGYVQQLAADEGAGEDAPKVVTHGFSAPLYHYTGWQVLEMYFATPDKATQFLTGPELHLAVVPEETLNGQWANTSTGEYWRWLQANYTLDRLGQSGAYTIYRIDYKAGSP